MRKIGIVELEAAMAVARRRSFRAASSDLGVSPTALSQTIAGLEARLDVRLFNRTTRSVSPTNAGEQFLAEVEPAVGAINHAVETVNSQSGQARRLTADQQFNWSSKAHSLPNHLGVCASLSRDAGGPRDGGSPDRHCG
jgi:DNA-binding transcriptional LysR family regulator